MREASRTFREDIIVEPGKSSLKWKRDIDDKDLLTTLSSMCAFAHVYVCLCLPTPSLPALHSNEKDFCNLARIASESEHREPLCRVERVDDLYSKCALCLSPAISLGCSDALSPSSYQWHCIIFYHKWSMQSVLTMLLFSFHYGLLYAPFVVAFNEKKMQKRTYDAVYSVQLSYWINECIFPIRFHLTRDKFLICI